MVYDNPVAYIEDAGADMQTRITRLSTIIYNLEIMMAGIGSNGNVLSYQFNDGQSTINTSYRSLKDITDAINAFETIRTRLINKCQGRATLLRDADTLVRRIY